jgi:large subunit ribosomal protein L25
MQETFEIKAESRSDTGKGASRRLRREGKVPAIIYGAHKDPEMISVDHNEMLGHLDHEAFYSHILTVQVGSDAQRVILKDLQRHPAKPFILHVDFQRVSEDEKLRTNVPIHFVNEETSPGVKMGGLVTHTITDIEISCLPKDLPEFIEVDMGEMEVGDIVHVQELKLPAGVEVIHTDPDQAVVSIHSGRAAAADEEESSEGGEE